MNPKPITKALGSHRIVLQEACPQDRDRMMKLPGDDRFCRSCNKVVHNLRDKSEAEIVALFEANGGTLCGTIQVRRFVPKKQIQLAPIGLRKPAYLRHLAATASLLLLSQGMMAAPATPPTYIAWSLPQSGGMQDLNDALDPKSDPDWSQNTLVSCIFVYGDSSEIDLDLKVSIFSGGILITQATAHHGLLKIDLAGKVKPEAMVGIVVAQNAAFNPDDPEQAFKHKGVQKVVRLRDAQNVVMKVEFEIMWSEEIFTTGGVEVMEPESIQPPEMLPRPEPFIIEEPQHKDGPDPRDIDQ